MNFIFQEQLLDWSLSLSIGRLMCKFGTRIVMNLLLFLCRQRWHRLCRTRCSRAYWYATQWWWPPSSPWPSPGTGHSATKRQATFSPIWHRMTDRSLFPVGSSSSPISSLSLRSLQWLWYAPINASVAIVSLHSANWENDTSRAECEGSEVESTWRLNRIDSHCIEIFAFPSCPFFRFKFPLFSEHRLTRLSCIGLRIFTI